jgi:hypothetical protein
VHVDPQPGLRAEAGHLAPVDHGPVEVVLALEPLALGDVGDVDQVAEALRRQDGGGQEAVFGEVVDVLEDREWVQVGIERSSSGGSDVTSQRKTCHPVSGSYSNRIEYGWVARKCSKSSS